MSEIKYYTYTVAGTEIATTDLLYAIAKAKERAIAERAKTLIHRNGNPYSMVDRKGILVSL